MSLFEQILDYYDEFDGKYDAVITRHKAAAVSKQAIIECNNQFLSDLINLHAKCGLISQYVSINSILFKHNMTLLFGSHELVKEIIKVGSNISDYFGYCGFCSDSPDISAGFSLIIDKNCLAFSHNNVRAISDLVSKNIRFRKVEYVATKFDPAYQLPTYSLLGVNFNIVPGAEVKHPFIDF